jgi:hypothetical protein
VAGNNRKIDVSYGSLGGQKAIPPEKLTSPYEYWVYLDHHPGVKSAKERTKLNQERNDKYLKENGGVMADWIKDGEFADIFYYTKEPHYKRKSKKTGPYRFVGNQNFNIKFWVCMEEDNESSMTRGRVRQEVGWTCGPTTIVKVMQVLLTLHYKKNCIFTGPRWRERLEKDGWNKLGDAVCSPHILETASDAFVVWDNYYDASDAAILDYCCDTLLKSGIDGKTVKELYQRPPDCAVKVDGDPEEEKFFYWDVKHPVVAGMIKAKIDNGHKEQPKKPKVRGKK